MEPAPQARGRLAARRAAHRAAAGLRSATGSVPGRGRDAFGLLAFLGLAFAALVAGGVAAATAPSGWYASLAKPSWTPPQWVFGPVWTLLYPALALAGWRALRERRSQAASLLFFGQLAVNAVWPWLFFGAGRIDLAFYDAVLLFATVSLTVAAFWRVHRGAALLLVPYWAWSGFAAVLMRELARLNPAA